MDFWDYSNVYEQKFGETNEKGEFFCSTNRKRNCLFLCSYISETDEGAPVFPVILE